MNWNDVGGDGGRKNPSRVSSPFFSAQGEIDFGIEKNVPIATFLSRGRNVMYKLWENCSIEIFWGESIAPSGRQSLRCDWKEMVNLIRCSKRCLKQTSLTLKFSNQSCASKKITVFVKWFFNYGSNIFLIQASGVVPLCRGLNYHTCSRYITWKKYYFRRNQTYCHSIVEALWARISWESLLSS